MRQFYTIAANSFMELVRQPVCLLLTSSSAVFMVFLACVPYFGLGDDPRLVKDAVLAVMLISGLLGAVLSATSSLSHEIRTGTVLAVLSKPVDRLQFLLAKFVGVAAALTLMAYVNAVAALLASRMAYDAYSATDRVSLALFLGAVVLAFAIGGFTNYFLRRHFVADAIFSLVILVTLTFILINNFSEHLVSLGEKAQTDWRLVPATVLILFALWIMAGLAVACSTRLEMIPTLAVITGFFMLGLLSQYLFGKLADQGSWWAATLYAMLPDWQLFWMADTLNKGQAGVPMSYLIRAFGYMAGYLGAILMVAALLFEERELS